MKIQFERVGRNHDVADLDAPDGLTPDELADRIYSYVRPKLLSQDVEVLINSMPVADREGHGFIAVGLHNGGTFTITKEES